MAKYVFTIEDRQGGVTLSLHKSEGPIAQFGKSTQATRMTKRLLAMAEMEAGINATPACKLLPLSTTCH